MNRPVSGWLTVNGEVTFLFRFGLNPNQAAILGITPPR
jgi:hypothetical protein